MNEPLIPLPPEGPRFEARDVPTCRKCSGLVRRDLLAQTNEGQRFGPWRCDLHGEVTPHWEHLDVPTGYDDSEGAYELSDPKHPRHHEVYADLADHEDIDREDSR